MRWAIIAGGLIAWGAFGQSALGASRARYGGVLRVAVGTRSAETDPSLAGPPAEAAVRLLTTSPLCRLDAAGRLRPLLASEIAWEVPLRLRVELRTNLELGDAALSAEDVLASWSRLSHLSSLSPYRALLFALREERGHLSSSTAGRSLELPLAFPWPDLAASLCHPALAIRPRTGSGHGVGPFRASSPNELEASLAFPLGRPFVDKISLAFVDERVASRRLALHQADLAIGGASLKSASWNPPKLYATYLLFRAERAGADFREAFEAAIDRSDLTRFFVPPPAQAMYALLPQASMPAATPPPRPAPPAHPSGRALALLYDESLPEQRLIAQRLQLKLHDFKYAIALRSLGRAALRAAWAAGQFDLMLQSVLLPPAAGPALAVALELAGRHELLAAELPLIGALPDEAARERAALERARALLPSLALIPLYAQGLSAAAGERVASFALDGHGLPALDDAFLLPE